jgi:pyruvate dehydrogenase phosphatase
MRRAAVQTFRIARRSSIRRLVGSKSSFNIINHGLSLRPAASIRRYSTSPTHLQSSMHLRNFSLAFVTSLVAGGAYYAYTGEGAKQFLNRTDAADNVSVQQTRALSTASNVLAEATGQSQHHSTATAAAESSRRALVVDNDQFYTGAIVGNEPLSKDTDDFGRKVLEMMTPEQATERLRKNEESYLVGRGKGVVRYDIVQLPSNDPIEDDHAEKIVEVPSTVAATDNGAPNSDWMFWGVFDGHSGWTTSARLRQVLISFAARELNSTYKAALTNTVSPFPPASAIDAALKTAFVKLDHEICHESVNKLTKNPSKRLGAELLAPALSGSCALLSFYDTRSKTFRVACTGDSRAVLGRRNPQSGKWFATPLSEDQTGSNPNEEARMRAEHPGEPHVIRNGRVLGNLEPTRAFGDAVYKWSRETQDKIKRHFFGKTPHQFLQTPPYVTAEPVVTSTHIEPEKGDFIVLATDGLWEMLTNEEVIGLVGQWIEKQSSRTSNSSSTAWLTSWFKPSDAPLPVEKGGNSGRSGIDGDKSTAPIRQQQWNLDSTNEARFVLEDKNAATHLIRNALGGKDRDMVCALLTLPSPYSRRYRYVGRSYVLPYKLNY